MDSNSKLAKSMTHHNQTTELTTWFLNFSSQFRLYPPGKGCIAILLAAQCICYYISFSMMVVNSKTIVFDQF
jgi:hypothetical protein